MAGLIMVIILMVACSPENQPIREPIGDFRLGHVIVSAKEAQTTDWSRKASEEQLVEAVKTAVGERFGSLRGGKFYHVAITVQAYLLPPPGVPVVASPKAGLHVSVQIWDDSTRSILNEEARQMTVTESSNADTFVGSGYAHDGEEQLERATRAFALELERWLRSEESPLPGIGIAAGQASMSGDPPT